jgi:hypothetical protein
MTDKEYIAAIKREDRKAFIGLTLTWVGLGLLVISASAFFAR